jgi:hypothetical protein
MLLLSRRFHLCVPDEEFDTMSLQISVPDASGSRKHQGLESQSTAVIEKPDWRTRCSVLWTSFDQ